MSQKYAFVFASLLIALIALSCNNFNDDAIVSQSEPPNQFRMEPPPLSASHIVDSVFYTFAIPKVIYGINDTLSATLTMYNLSVSVKTLYFVCSPSYSVLWSLNNASGQTLLYGPGAICQVIAPLLLNPHQSLQYLIINEPIKNIQGISLDNSDYYVLHGQMNEMSLPWSFDLYITIK